MTRVDQRTTTKWLGWSLAGIILFCLMAILGMISVLRTPAGNTSKPESKIPETAVWYEGIGGGNWIDLVNTTNDQEFHLRIYQDFTGEKVLDTWFSLSGNCLEYKIPVTKFHRLVRSFDGTSIRLEMEDGRKDCELKQVFPRQGIAGTRIFYEINQKRVSQQEFESMKATLVLSDDFQDGEMIKASQTKRDAHRHGKVYLRDARDEKTGKSYQYSVSTLGEQTVYALTLNKKKSRAKN